MKNCLVMKNITDQHGINKNLLLPGRQVVGEVTKVGKSRNFSKSRKNSKKLEKVGDLMPCLKKTKTKQHSQCDFTVLRKHRRL